MLFDKHQSRLWHEMLDHIEAFRKQELSYSDLVYGLEGALDAGEFNNEKIVKQWYDYWTPFEIWSATKGNSVTMEEVNSALSDMESFLKSMLLENKEE